MRALLLRVADTPFGVFGFLYLFEGQDRLVAKFVTAEDDWRDNAPGRSCIPAGTFTCVKRTWHKHNLPTYEITGVPGRLAILFHPLNTEEGTEGCIGIGYKFVALTVQDEDSPGRELVQKWGIGDSRAAFSRFRYLLGDRLSFPLTIRWAEPGEWRAFG